MTRTFWPASLDELLDQPVIPQCAGCAWSAVCPSDVQSGIASLLKSQHLTVAQCIWFQRFQRLYRKETGHEPPEGFAPEDLAYTLAERRSVKEGA